MAQRELDILAEARITLNDVSTSSPRWSDERLMQLLSNGQDDMCRNIPMVVNKANITTVGGQEEYKLPSDSVKLIRASSYVNDGSSIPTKTINKLTLISYDEIERDNPEWESDYSSDFSAIVVNALSQQTIRPYPLLATDVAYSKIIRCSYQAMPVKLGWYEDDSVEELTINEMWDYGLTQYVVGMAFLDYGDASSISRSQVALGLYGKEAMKAEKLAKKSFTKRVVTTGYQAKVFHRTNRSSQGRNNGYRNTRY